ncbi:helix-turn-helix domain-containing protein [Methylobacterium aquaticum]|uniref:helix-turn-helix domain-containing protein n=1 Tax=Methylobacterium aquaticum TaxID=270351 RepID=UPI0009E55413
MVSKWRNRFLSDRVEGLYDRPRSGAPRRIDDAQVETLVLDTPSPPRADRQRPSRRG